jgi:hypothetical protein
LLPRSELNKLNKSPQFWRGSFSAGWTATIARVGAFFNISRDLQDLRSFAPLFPVPIPNVAPLKLEKPSPRKKEKKKQKTRQNFDECE